MDREDGVLNTIGATVHSSAPEILNSVVNQIAETANAKLFQWPMLGALTTMSEAFGAESIATSRLVPLANDGLNVAGLVHRSGLGYGFSRDQNYIDLAKKLIEQGEPVNKLEARTNAKHS